VTSFLIGYLSGCIVTGIVLTAVQMRRIRRILEALRARESAVPVREETR